MLHPPHKAEIVPPVVARDLPALAGSGQALSTGILTGGPSMGYTLLNPGMPEKIEYGGGPRAEKPSLRK